jgi:hypothetical protein
MGSILLDWNQEVDDVDRRESHAVTAGGYSSEARDFKGKFTRGGDFAQA